MLAMMMMMMKGETRGRGGKARAGGTPAEERAERTEVMQAGLRGNRAAQPRGKIRRRCRCRRGKHVEAARDLRVLTLEVGENGGHSAAPAITAGAARGGKELGYVAVSAWSTQRRRARLLQRGGTDGPTPATSTATCGDEEELPKNLLTTAIRCDDEQTLGVFTTTTAPACTTAQTPSTAIRPEGERPGAPLSKAHRTSAEVQCNKQTKPSAPAPACTTAQTQGTAIRPKGERPCAPLSEAHRTSPEMRCKRKQAELPAPDHACTIAHAPGTALHPEGKRPDAPLSTAAYEHAPRSAFSTEHPWEPTPGSMSGLSTEHPWELAPGSMSGLRTEHPWELAPGSMSGLRTEHPWELTPGSMSGLRTEHPWEPTPGSLPGQHSGYTYELAPCTEQWGHRWRSALETTRCRGAACIEF
ncbi:hypothetical protein T484DRAFT_1861343 [Baffinella frigidus]|nr:hypothetical protein T484DRAFT_1861343 [Cryptophyta sp. CCMP2293]